MLYRVFGKSLETTAPVQVVTLQMRRPRTRKGEDVVVPHPTCVPRPETGCVAKGGKESAQGEWEGQGQSLFGNHFLGPPMVCRAFLGLRDTGGEHGELDILHLSQDPPFPPHPLPQGFRWAQPKRHTGEGLHSRRGMRLGVLAHSLAGH